MDFRKIFFGFLILIFSNQVSAQVDSTDLNFYATEFEPVTQQDSMYYSSGDYLKLFFEFETSNVQGFEKLWIEVISSDGESLPQSVYLKSYTLAQLVDLDIIDNGLVSLGLLVVSSSGSYQIFIRVEDTIGREIVSISKYLVQ